ncbi:MAG: TrmB family transcriptional regulator [Candidatus Nanoarchaeia archaeon]
MQGLKDFGLSDNEISVFVQLVKFGPQSVWKIATATGMKRTSTYDIIKGLIKKDLVLVEVSGKKNFYSAADPSVIVEQFNLKKESITESVKNLNKIKSKEENSTKLIRYTGVSGIRTAMGLLLLSRHAIHGYGNNKLSEKILSFYPENFSQKRIEKRITLKAIMEPKGSFSTQSPDFNKFTEIRFNNLMKEQPVVYFLQNGKVIMLKLDGINPEAVYIEDKSFYESQQKIFDYLWKSSKK